MTSIVRLVSILLWVHLVLFKVGRYHSGVVAVEKVVAVLNARFGAMLLVVELPDD